MIVLIVWYDLFDIVSPSQYTNINRNKYHYYCSRIESYAIFIYIYIYIYINKYYCTDEFLAKMCVSARLAVHIE
jgi:hypothetical protein